MAAKEDALKALAERLAIDPEAAGALKDVVDQFASRRMEQRERARQPDRVKVLLERHQQYLDTESFQPGDLVVWKAGMKNRNMPDYGVPAVVVEVLDPPVFDEEKGSGSAYFREPLSLRLGLVDDDDEFLTYHFDGRRFTHFQQE